jgi:hypothetical protein
MCLQSAIAALGDLREDTTLSISTKELTKSMHACDSTLASSSSIIALISGTPYLVTTTFCIVLLIIRYIIRAVRYVIVLKKRALLCYVRLFDH